MISDGIPRLRMFAGPNGSGKSTIKTVVRPELLGVYINPDEIQREIDTKGRVDLIPFCVPASESSWRSHLNSSTLARRIGIDGLIEHSKLVESTLYCSSEKQGPYLASIIADFIRNELLNARQSFTFETVMSSPDKIEILKRAKSAGYRTYLYYIATDDPIINLWRVKRRVHFGGHDVPEDKIISRYHRSLGLLMDAIRNTDRAYVFDNSGDIPLWIAEFTDGRKIDLKIPELPHWFTKAMDGVF